MAATPTEMTGDEPGDIEFHLWTIHSPDGSWSPVLLPGIEPPHDIDGGERVSHVASMYAPADVDQRVVIDTIMALVRRGEVPRVGGLSAKNEVNNPSWTDRGLTDWQKEQWRGEI
jgi:hypothetical protein